MAKQKRIAFLLGAGASVAVGMPTTNDITKEILSKNRVKIAKQIQEQEFSDNDILEFINYLLAFAEQNNQHTFDTQYGKEKHAVNYEDLYYMIEQIYHSHGIKGYNLFGHLLYERLFNEALKEKHEKHEEDTGVILSRQFITEAKRYIIEALIGFLKERQSDATINLTNLRVITDALNDKIIKIANVFTLNHDTILERLLSENNIMYCDGFEITDAEIRKWAPELFGNLKNKQNGVVNLYKLHGSIDWHHYYRTRKTKEGKTVPGIYAINQKVKTENETVNNSKGEEYQFYSNIILIGTKNKTDSYLETNYWELFYRFRTALRNIDVVVVLGYSFGDSGINGQLLEWVLNLKYKKLIVVNTGGRASFRNKLDHRLQEYFEANQQKILYIEAKIEELDWEMLKEEYKEYLE